MSIVHEAVCDGCGKREPARYPNNSNMAYWEVAEHPEGWFLVAIAGAQGRTTAENFGRYQAYCSRRCVALGEEVESKESPAFATLEEVVDRQSWRSFS